jgi:hypothetical protein
MDELSLPHKALVEVPDNNALLVKVIIMSLSYTSDGLSVDSHLNVC